MINETHYSVLPFLFIHLSLYFSFLHLSLALNFHLSFSPSSFHLFSFSHSVSKRSLPLYIIITATSVILTGFQRCSPVRRITYAKVIYINAVFIFKFANIFFFIPRHFVHYKKIVWVKFDYDNWSPLPGYKDKKFLIDFLKKVSPLHTDTSVHGNVLWLLNSVNIRMLTKIGSSQLLYD